MEKSIWTKNVDIYFCFSLIKKNVFKYKCANIQYLFVFTANVIKLTNETF